VIDDVIIAILKNGVDARQVYEEPARGGKQGAYRKAWWSRP